MDKEKALERLSALESEAAELRKIIETPEIKRPSPEEVFSEITAGLVIHLYENYPNSVFFMKEGLAFFELDFKNNYLWCRPDKVWDVLYSSIGENNNATQSFIKNQVEQRYKLKGFTPHLQPCVNSRRWNNVTN